ncbi:hypothetical protein [Xanthomonas citri]|uniref:hypothetical protein n=1 Tax=Xanthomonas citri TaxID=346 RepID=UPI001932947A|nr:hypothetical protein [Xanthomonas citri]QRD62611.1 hypothetical protein H8Z74_23240 [Xanthomonas citri pv. citri]QRD67145.1 hypothetical protein H8Z73_22215 [Xanthomonas citri pv. citri]
MDLALRIPKLLGILLGHIVLLALSFALATTIIAATHLGSGAAGPGPMALAGAIAISIGLSSGAATIRRWPYKALYWGIAFAVALMIGLLCRASIEHYRRGLIAPPPIVFGRATNQTVLQGDWTELHVDTTIVDPFLYSRGLVRYAKNADGSVSYFFPPGARPDLPPANAHLLDESQWLQPVSQ